MAFSTKHSWVSLGLLGIGFQHVILSFGQQTERNSVSRNEQLDTQLSPASPPQWYAALTIYTSMCSIVYPIQLNRRCVKLFESIWVWTWNSFRYGILLGLCSSQFRGESVEKSWIKLELIMMRFPLFWRVKFYVAQNLSNSYQEFPYLMAHNLHVSNKIFYAQAGGRRVRWWWVRDRDI